MVRAEQELCSLDDYFLQIRQKVALFSSFTSCANYITKATQATTESEQHMQHTCDHVQHQTYPNSLQLSCGLQLLNHFSFINLWKYTNCQSFFFLLLEAYISFRYFLN